MYIFVKFLSKKYVLNTDAIFFKWLVDSIDAEPTDGLATELCDCRVQGMSPYDFSIRSPLRLQLYKATSPSWFWKPLDYSSH